MAIVTVGEACLPGGELSVRVEVAANETGRIPVAASFALCYPAAAVELLRVEDGALGTAQVASEGTDSGAERCATIVTLSNSANADSTPVVFTAVFRVLEGRPAGYGISLATPEGVASPLVAAGFAPVASTVDQAGGQGLCANSGR